MANEPSYLVDTNILLRLSKQDDPNHGVVQIAIDALTKRGAQLATPLKTLVSFGMCAPGLPVIMVSVCRSRKPIRVSKPSSSS